MSTLRAVRVFLAAGCAAALMASAPVAGAAPTQADTAGAGAAAPGRAAAAPSGHRPPVPWGAAAAPVADGPAAGTDAAAAARKARIEAAWATKPEVRDSVAAAVAARARGEQPQAPAAAVTDGADGADGEVGVQAVRDDVVWNARWYWEFGTPYVWSTYWTPCDEYGADCECLNRLAYYWGAGIQLHYTLQGQANAGWYTSYPRRGDLVFWDYDGDGWFGPYDHTGVYTGNGYVIHASTYWGQVAWTTVSVVSQEAYGTYYINILG